VLHNLWKIKKSPHRASPLWTPTCGNGADQPGVVAVVADLGNGVAQPGGCGSGRRLGNGAAYLGGCGVVTGPMFLGWGRGSGIFSAGVLRASS